MSVSQAGDSGPPSTTAPQGTPPQADGGGGAATVAAPATEPGQLSGGAAAVSPILDGLTRPLSSRERQRASSNPRRPPRWTPQQARRYRRARLGCHRRGSADAGRSDHRGGVLEWGTAASGAAARRCAPTAR